MTSRLQNTAEVVSPSTTTVADALSKNERICSAQPAIAPSPTSFPAPRTEVGQPQPSANLPDGPQPLYPSLAPARLTSKTGDSKSRSATTDYRLQAVSLKGGGPTTQDRLVLVFQLIYSVRTRPRSIPGQSLQAGAKEWSTCETLMLWADEVAYTDNPLGRRAGQHKDRRSERALFSCLSSSSPSSSSSLL